MGWTRRSLLASLGTALARPAAARKPRIEVGIYPTPAALRASVDRVNAVACAVEQALRDAVPDADLCVGPSGGAPTPPAHDSAHDRNEWWQRVGPQEYADANLLLLDEAEVAPNWDLKGAAFVGGTTAVGVGTGVREELARWLALHEVGHCLGLEHGVGERQERPDGTAVATPMLRGDPDDPVDGLASTYSEAEKQLLQSKTT